jgi:xanthine dehydrogenase accessory factor
VLALAPLPFDVRWIDARADAFPGFHPGNVTPIATADPVREIAQARPGTLLLVMTHSHTLDLDLVAAGLSNPAIAFTGVIGSATKRARFLSRLKTMGLGEEAAARLVCPIGVTGLNGKEPAIIAAGVTVQMLEKREHLMQRALPENPASRKKSAHR